MEGGKDPLRIPVQLPPTFVAMASGEKDPLMTIEERKETIVNKTFNTRTWDLLFKILVEYGVTQHNLMAFEFTYLHWYQQLEHVPMSLDTEQVLAPLHKVELESFLKDFPPTMDPNARSHYEEILVDSLTNIRNFISSFGRTVQDFLKQDRSKVERTGTVKGQGLEGLFGKGGKSQGKSGSKNQPKEPAPPSKPEGQTPIVKTTGLAPVAKPGQPAVLAKTEPQGPPTKAGESASLAVPHQSQLQFQLVCRLNQQ